MTVNLAVLQRLALPVGEDTTSPSTERRSCRNGDCAVFGGCECECGCTYHLGEDGRTFRRPVTDPRCVHPDRCRRGVAIQGRFAFWGGSRDHEPVTVYGLLDADGAVRYVGQSQNARARVRAHWTGSRRSWDSPLKCWLRTLSEPPTSVTLAVVPRYLAFETERRWTLGAVERYGDLVLNRNAGAHPVEDEFRVQAARDRVAVGLPGSPANQVQLVWSGNGFAPKGEEIDW